MKAFAYKDICSWQDWQQIYGSNIACKGLHVHTITSNCICCQSVIEIDTDKEIDIDDLKCNQCKEIEPNYLIASKILMQLHMQLCKHFKF